MRILLRAVVATAAMLAVIMVPAKAQRLVDNPGGVLPGVSFDQGEPVLRDAGMSTQRRVIDGTPVLVVQANGRILNLQNRACSLQGECGGLWMFAFLDDSAPLSTMSRFNQVSKPARANLLDGKVVLDRYLIADYGITRGSLVVNVGVFAASVDQWFAFNEASGPQQRVSFDPIMAPPSQGLSQPMAGTVNSFDHETTELLGKLLRNGSLANSAAADLGPMNPPARQR